MRPIAGILALLALLAPVSLGAQERSPDWDVAARLVDVPGASSWFLEKRTRMQRVRTATGELEVGIARGTSAYLDLHTQFGKVINDFRCWYMGRKGDTNGGKASLGANQGKPGRGNPGGLKFGQLLPQTGHFSQKLFLWLVSVVHPPYSVTKIKNPNQQGANGLDF